MKDALRHLKKEKLLDSEGQAAIDIVVPDIDSDEIIFLDELEEEMNKLLSNVGPVKILSIMETKS